MLPELMDEEEEAMLLPAVFDKSPVDPAAVATFRKMEAFHNKQHSTKDAQLRIEAQRIRSEQLSDKNGHQEDGTSDRRACF